MEVTESSLASALESFRLGIRATGGGRVSGEVYDPDEVAKVLYATLDRMAALRETHPTGPRLADAELCARCGNQFKPGQVCDACRESHSYQLAEALEPDGTNVLGMDHACEHLIGDREVQLMVDILRGMAGLDDEARQRIRNWVDERFVPRRLNPF